jgi:hypothetical protein
LSLLVCCHLIVLGLSGFARSFDVIVEFRHQVKGLELFVPTEPQVAQHAQNPTDLPGLMVVIYARILSTLLKVLVTNRTLESLRFQEIIELVTRYTVEVVQSIVSVTIKAPTALSDVFAIPLSAADYTDAGRSKAFTTSALYVYIGHQGSS